MTSTKTTKRGDNMKVDEPRYNPFGTTLSDAEAQAMNAWIERHPGFTKASAARHFILLGLGLPTQR